MTGVPCGMRDDKHGCAGEVGCRQTIDPGKMSNVIFRQTSLLERRQDGEFRGGARPGPQIRRIVGIFSIGNGGKSAFRRERIHPRKELRLAKVAAVRRVVDIQRIFKLTGGDDFNTHLKALLPR